VDAMQHSAKCRGAYPRGTLLEETQRARLPPRVALPPSKTRLVESEGNNSTKGWRDSSQKQKKCVMRRSSVSFVFEGNPSEVIKQSEDNNELDPNRDNESLRTGRMAELRKVIECIMWQRDARSCESP